MAKRFCNSDWSFAARVLKAIGPAAEKPVLLVLESAEPPYRREAAKVLAEVGSRDSLAPLEKAWRITTPSILRRPKSALAAVKGRLEDEDTK